MSGRVLVVVPYVAAALLPAVTVGLLYLSAGASPLGCVLGGTVGGLVGLLGATAATATRATVDRLVERRIDRQFRTTIREGGPDAH